jgi:hypothetical protein
LRVCLDVSEENADLGKLLSLARNRGLIDKEEFKALDNVRVLRNRIVHGGLVSTFRRKTAVGMFMAVGDAVSDLYQRAASGRGGPVRPSTP